MIVPGREPDDEDPETQQFRFGLYAVSQTWTRLS